MLPKNFNPQINLPFNFLIQKYFVHENPTWNINYSDSVDSWSTYLLMVKKEYIKIGIDKFDVDLELNPCLENSIVFLCQRVFYGVI